VVLPDISDKSVERSLACFLARCDILRAFLDRSTCKKSGWNCGFTAQSIDRLRAKILGLSGHV